jgi:hypothetical protein
VTIFAMGYRAAHHRYSNHVALRYRRAFAYRIRHSCAFAKSGADMAFAITHNNHSVESHVAAALNDFRNSSNRYHMFGKF